MYYTTEKLSEIFGRFDNLQIFGINFFGNSIEELTGLMQLDSHDTEFYSNLLEAEEDLRQLLPVEYARHILVIGEKKINKGEPIAVRKFHKPGT